MNEVLAIFIIVTVILQIIAAMVLACDHYLFGCCMDWKDLTVIGYIINILWLIYTIPARLLLFVVMALITFFSLMCSRNYNIGDFRSDWRVVFYGTHNNIRALDMEYYDVM